MGIVFLLLLLAQFEPEPRFGVSILQEQQLARNDLVNAQAAIRVRQRAGWLNVSRVGILKRRITLFCRQLQA
jgi:hypothetical protein